MRTIIAGSRTLGVRQVEAAMRTCPWQPTEVVSGRAHGVDQAGERWAADHDIPLTCFPADWKRHGIAAGFLRNRTMAEYGQALVAVWDGRSDGTRHMIRIAQEKGLAVHIWTAAKDVDESNARADPGDRAQV